MLRLVPALRRSLDQVTAHAATWAERNAAVLAGDGEGPLWVVLGDSTAQGVGVAHVDEGYVGRVRRLLEARDGRTWAVLNLSRSGAVLDDVLDVQLPRLRDLPRAPALVTAVAGGNDLRRRRTTLVQRLPELVSGLPAGSAVATLPRGLREPRAREANALLRRLAAERGLPVVDLWAVTGPPWRGKYAADWFHPNDAGYEDWAGAFIAAL